LYSSKPAYVFGFHGLDETVALEILNGKKDFKHSKNPYDWLGHGIYFWENSHERARQYAVESKTRKGSTIKNPFVLGAIIDLGNCFDLLDKRHVDLLQIAHSEMSLALKKQGKKIPVNTGFSSTDFDFKKRQLDCAVICYAVDMVDKYGHQLGFDKPFDSVRAAFWEGEPIYQNAGFKSHNHIQLCIINHDCIKGVFLPRDKQN
jgi:hypothetical protein